MRCLAGLVIGCAVVIGCTGDEFAFSSSASSGAGGGTGAVGGAGGFGGSTTSTSGSGGDAGSGGEGGSGPEDCLNGVDDKGDNLVDCEDPKCQEGFVCVPAVPSG
ncbi:MAG: hypothetical protein DRI90_03215, partial [Deltaproteobacteria bacterium]